MKINFIRVEDYLTEEGCKEFAKQLAYLKQSTPVGWPIPVMDGDKLVCYFTFDVPDEAKKLLPKHRRITDEWKPSQQLPPCNSPEGQ
jgi:hypothetical protein